MTFIKRQSSWNKGKKLSEEHKNKLRLAKLGKKQTKEHIEKRRLKMIGKFKGRKLTQEWIDKIKETKKGVPVHTNESKSKLGEISKKRWQSEEYKKKRLEGFMKRVTPEFRLKMSQISKSRWSNLEYKNKVSATIKNSLNTKSYKEGASKRSKARWQNEEYAKRVIQNTWKATTRKPNSYEEKISNICISNNLPFYYCGDGTFLIGRRNPDFINKRDKIAIEVYSRYWKIKRYGSCENYEKERTDYFAKYGWKVIFIRENEIKSKYWDNICLNKLKGRI